MLKTLSANPSPSPFENMRASTASHAENKCSTYTRYASALFSAVSLYLLRLFSKGFVFPLPARIAVSGKTSNKMFLLLLILLADCRYLCTINTMQRYTSIGTALSAPIFLPLLLFLSGVFPLNRFKNRTCITRAAKRISASIAVPGYYRPYFCLLLIYGRNSFCGKESIF